jgi:sec-independent protein translocase protein TatA
MPWGLSPVHLLVILLILLIVVGPGKLPETGAAIGKALRGFKDALEGEPNRAAAQAPAAQPPQPQIPMSQAPQGKAAVQPADPAPADQPGEPKNEVPRQV